MKTVGLVVLLAALVSAPAPASDLDKIVADYVGLYRRGERPA